MIILLICILLAGCGRNKGEVELTEPAKTEVTVSDMIEVEKSLDESGAQKEFLKQMSVDRVNFGFDKYSVSEEAGEYLKKVAEYLNTNIDIKIEIQGNCDIRGLPAYNISLGENRANAVMKYLQKLGVDAKRMTTVSFGSRVLVEGDNETAYAQNRVAIIVIK